MFGKFRSLVEVFKHLELVLKWLKYMHIIYRLDCILYIFNHDQKYNFMKKSLYWYKQWRVDNSVLLKQLLSYCTRKIKVYLLKKSNWKENENCHKDFIITWTRHFLYNYLVFGLKQVINVKKCLFISIYENKHSNWVLTTL